MSSTMPEDNDDKTEGGDPSVTAFETWLEGRGHPNLSDRVALAHKLYREAYSAQELDGNPNLEDSTAVQEMVEHLENSLVNVPTIVTWKGISVDWFLDCFCQTAIAKHWRDFGCQLWFIRNVCVPVFLRQNQVAEGTFCDGLPRLKWIWNGGMHDAVAKPIVADATVFLSYTGRYSFSHFINLLSSLRGEYIWIDIFCVDQFAWTGGRGSEEMKSFKKTFTENLQDRIGDIRRTAAMLETWDEIMSTVGQIWVLWEIFCTLESGADLTILLSPLETDKFCKTLEKSYGQARSLLNGIDVSLAVSEDPFDRSLIHGLMEDQGIHNVNVRISALVRQWLLDKSRQYLTQQRQLQHGVSQSSLISVAYLLFEQGREAEAQNLLRESIEIGKQSTVDPEATVSASIMLGGATNDPEESESIFRSALSISMQHFGEDHYMTCVCRANLGSVLPDATEKETFLRDTLEKFRSHPKIDAELFFTTVLNFAVILDSHGKAVEAVGYFDEATSGSRRYLGDNHPLTIRCLLAATSRMKKAFDRSDGLFPQGTPQKPSKVLMEALRSAEQRLGPEHAETQNAKLAVAEALAEEGDFFQAAGLCRETLGQTSSSFGPHHEKTLSGMDLLADILSSALRDIEKTGHSDPDIAAEAESLKRGVLRGRQAAGTETAAVLSAMNNLAIFLMEQTKRPHPDHHLVIRNRTWELDKMREAESLMRHVMNERRKLFGERHVQTLRAIDNFGTILKSQGRFREGRPFLEEACEGFSLTLGYEHQYTRNCFSKLNEIKGEEDDDGSSKFIVELELDLDREGKSARALLNGGKHAEAADEYHKIILGLEDDDPEKFVRLHELAYALFQCGKMEESENYHRQALLGRQRVFEKEDPRTIASIVHLATQLQEQDKNDEALLLYGAAMEQMQRNEEMHSLFGQALFNLAKLRQEQGDVDEAVALVQCARERNSLAWKNDSIEFGCLYYLALFRKDQGRIPEAASCFEESLDGRRKLLGSEHPETMASMLGLARLLEDNSQFAEAEPLYRGVLRGTERQYNKRHPKTLNILESLFHTLIQQKKFDEAERLGQDILAIQSTIDGQDTFNFLSKKFNLAQVCSLQGKISVARRVCQEILESLLGMPDGPQLRFLAKSCETRLADFEKAREDWNCNPDKISVVDGDREAKAES